MNGVYTCGDGCPFRRCTECAFKGWESDVAQGDSAASPTTETREPWDNGSEQKTAPAETRQRLDRGLTTAQLPTRPGGFSG